MALNPEQFKAHRYFGTGEQGMERMFSEGRPLTPVPWDQMGRRKDRQDYDRDMVADRLRKRPGPGDFEDVDPRILHATQPAITRAGVSHYIANDYRHGGPTYADQDMVGNQHPVVYRRESLTGGDPQHLLLSGHHRAASMLLQGQQFRARVVEGPWGPMRGDGPPDLTRHRPRLRDL